MGTNWTSINLYRVSLIVWTPSKSKVLDFYYIKNFSTLPKLLNISGLENPPRKEGSREPLINNVFKVDLKRLGGTKFELANLEPLILMFPDSLC